MWILLHGGKGVDFVDSTLFELGDLPKLIGFYDFDCDLLLGLDVNTLEHFSVDTLAQHFLQRVVIYNLTHNIIFTPIQLNIENWSTQIQAFENSYLL